ncbi:cytochrome c oxidase accessory protein CcoG [Piscinibacter aquaticus]|uniref:Cytochrome c oxidase accessory protein CcoG n=1 Tax=Piscinibacter aquaticus TaxID=392597 RepID=A0A5C6U4A1_9BURK|nr:cytochrome c oxidase accessory protein CcoG [Piscinibacter aquaticus]
MNTTSDSAGGTVQPLQFVPMYQKRTKIYARSVRGLYARLRWAIVALTQGVFFGLPWLQWNGRRAVLFDLDVPRFHVFGLVLQPQDLIFLAALLVIAALALFFFTALAGRLWCGYSCPQTVYSEIYQWIELKTEGDRHVRMKRDAMPWTVGKAARKTAKHALWIAAALAAGFTLVGYFVPIRDLGPHLAEAGIASWPAFWVLFYGGMLYGNAGWMREQICSYMCPYARIQSTLIDGDSLVIAYDNARGDPRGARPRRTDPASVGLGGCTDCTLCVQVCPAGIDIRNGLQNECIGCAACIDACDDVMRKMDYPTGLIRYATSRNGVAQGLGGKEMLRRVVRPRVLVYGGLLAAALVAFVAALATRAPVHMDVIRDRGVMARLGEEGQVQNLYRVQLTNRTERIARYRLGVEGLPDVVVETPADVVMAPGESKSLTVTLALPPAAAQGRPAGAEPVRLSLTEPGLSEPVLREKTTFLIPR